MTVRVRDHRGRRNRVAVDAIQPRARHLHEPQTARRGAHRRGEDQRDDHIEIRHERYDVLLVGEAQLAVHREVSAHALGEAGGQWSDEGGAEHGKLLRAQHARVVSARNYL